MPQINTKSLPARKPIDAGFPKNISEVDKISLEAKWNEAAKKREESIARETRIPTESSITLRYQLRKFGKHWNAFVVGPNGRFTPLLGAPSLLSSAVDSLTDYMTNEALKL